MRLPKDLATESLTWLKESDVTEAVQDPDLPTEMTEQPDSFSNINKIGHRRRMSVIGGGLYSVNKNIVEKGTDFLEKVPRTNTSVIKPASLVKSVGGLELLSQYDSESESDDGENTVPDEPISDLKKNSSCADNQPPFNDEIDEISSSINNVAISRAKSVISCEKKVPSLLPLLKNAEPDSIVRQMPRVNAISASGPDQMPTLFNDFCPFRRLPNLPFVINGRPRKRSKSVDFYGSKPPPLETLFETEEEYEKNAFESNIPDGNRCTIQADLFNNNKGQFGSPKDDISPNFTGIVTSGREFVTEIEFHQTQKTLNVVRKWVASSDD